MKPALYVLGGNVVQAKRYCLDRGIRGDSVRLLTHPLDLQGISEPTVVLTGTYYERRDLEWWYDMLRSRRAEVRYEPVLRPAPEEKGE